MSEWANVTDKLPQSPEGLWSEPVVAMCDQEKLYFLRYLNDADGGHWQRSTSFINNGSKHVFWWIAHPQDQAGLEDQLVEVEANRVSLVAALTACVEQIENEDPDMDCLDNIAAHQGRVVLIGQRRFEEWL